MSLLKRLTPKKLEANQANAPLSQGPGTAEGIERIRDVQLVHGTVLGVGKRDILREKCANRGTNPLSPLESVGCIKLTRHETT